MNKTQKAPEKSASQTGKAATDQKTIESLIELLRNKDGLKRRNARWALEKRGKAATPFLIEALSDKAEDCRWEAAKALIQIKDLRAAPALVKALMDRSFEIRWLAAEALITLKAASIPPLLQALIQHSDVVSLHQGAHHVLHALERERLLDKKTLGVLDELRNLDADVGIISAAQKALTQR